LASLISSMLAVSMKNFILAPSNSLTRLGKL
jgi:hypothetical protein